MGCPFFPFLLCRYLRCKWLANTRQVVQIRKDMTGSFVIHVLESLPSFHVRKILVQMERSPLLAVSIRIYSVAEISNMFASYSLGIWLNCHTSWAHQDSVLTVLHNVLWVKGGKEQRTCISCVTSLLTQILYYPTGPPQSTSVKMKLCKISRWPEQSIKPSIGPLSPSV